MPAARPDTVPPAASMRAAKARASVTSRTVAIAPAAAVAGASAQPASASPAPLPSPSGPTIYSVSATPRIVHAGDSISFSAHTSSDIVKVTAFVSAYTLPFTRTSSGVFTLAFSIPAHVPWFFHGTYSLNVVARSQQGTSVSRSVPVTFQ
jgi:hypothetical protein